MPLYHRELVGVWEPEGTYARLGIDHNDEAVVDLLHWQGAHHTPIYLTLHIDTGIAGSARCMVTRGADEREFVNVGDEGFAVHVHGIASGCTGSLVLFFR